MSTKSERTKNRIQQCALHLFTKRGYDKTTVEDIADCAGISHVTFFNHFPTKESTILEDPYDPAIENTIAALPSTLPPLQRAATGVLDTWETMSEQTALETFQRAMIIMNSPKLLSASYGYNQNSQLAIHNGLVASGTEDFEAQVIAGACIGAIMTAFSPRMPSDATDFASRLVHTLQILQRGDND